MGIVTRSMQVISGMRSTDKRKKNISSTKRCSMYYAKMSQKVSHTSLPY